MAACAKHRLILNQGHAVGLELLCWHLVVGLHAALTRRPMGLDRYAAASLAMNRPAVGVPVVVLDLLCELAVPFLVDVQAHQEATLLADDLLRFNRRLGFRLNEGQG